MGALFFVSCFSILCANPFTTVLIPLKYNAKHNFQLG